MLTALLMASYLFPPPTPIVEMFTGPKAGTCIPGQGEGCWTNSQGCTTGVRFCDMQGTWRECYPVAPSRAEDGSCIPRTNCTSLLGLEQGGFFTTGYEKPIYACAPSTGRRHPASSTVYATWLTSREPVYVDEDAMEAIPVGEPIQPRDPVQRLDRVYIDANLFGMQWEFCGDSSCNGDETDATCLRDCHYKDPLEDPLFGQIRRCATGLNGECLFGTQKYLINGRWDADCRPYVKKGEYPDTCWDGLDNDCDGTVDTNCGPPPW